MAKGNKFDKDFINLSQNYTIYEPKLQCSSSNHILRVCTNTQCFKTALYCNSLECKSCIRNHQMCQNVLLSSFTKLIKYRAERQKYFLSSFFKIKKQLIEAINRSEKDIFEKFKFGDLEEKYIDDIRQIYGNIGLECMSIKGKEMHQLYSRLQQSSGYFESVKLIFLEIYQQQSKKAIQQILHLKEQIFCELINQPLKKMSIPFDMKLNTVERLPFLKNKVIVTCKKQIQFIKQELNRSKQKQTGIFPIQQLLKKQLSAPFQVFDTTGYRQYDKNTIPKLIFRGGLPHFQPQSGYRFQLRASNIYDGGSNAWMEEDESQGRWAYAYFAINNQQYNYKNSKSRYANLNSFLAECDPFLRLITSSPFSKQHFKTLEYKIENLRNLNQKTRLQNNQIIGKGIQVAPHSQKALLNSYPAFESQKKLFYTIFECRIDSSFLKIPQSHDNVWILPSTKVLRPTALILYTQQQYNQVKNQNQNNTLSYEQFQWDRFEQKYNFFFSFKPKLRKIWLQQQSTRNLTILNLMKLKKHQPLNASDIRQLVKSNLQSLKQLNLKKNQIGDQGLQMLAKKQLSQLKIIDLSNNNISIKGVKFLLKTQWNEETNIKLNSVKSWNSEGVLLDIGKNITTIKSISQTPPDKIFEAIEQLCQKEVEAFFHSAGLLFEMDKAQRTPQSVQESNEIQDEIQNDVKELMKSKSISLLVAMKILKDDYLQDNEIYYSRKSTVLSQLSCGIIFGGMMDERIKFQHYIDQEQWDYDTIIKDDEQLQKYTCWYKEKMFQQFGINSEAKIIIHSVCKGSTPVQVSLDAGSAGQLNNNFTNNQQIKLIPFFKGFTLSPEEFDSRGDIQFAPISGAQTSSRGGFPYYQPVLGRRYGINILNKYDNGSNTWLNMNGSVGEWAVGYHGVNYPNRCLKAIMNGRQQGQMLIAGPAQAYSAGRAINKSGNQLVGSGVYFSPHFEVSLRSYTQLTESNQQKYRLIFQCRLKPTSIMVTSCQQYWVVQNSKDIRPYGIMLFTDVQATQIFNHIDNKGAQCIHKQFKWSQHEENFKKFSSLG